MNDLQPNPARFVAGSHGRLQPYLAVSGVIDHDHLAIRALAEEFRRPTELETTRVAYELVRDRMRTPTISMRRR
jgi:hypothetical protein